MTFQTVLVTLSAAQLGTLLYMAWKIGIAWGATQTTISDHGKRLDTLEPEVREIGTTLAGLKGEHRAQELAAHGD